MHITILNDAHRQPASPSVCQLYIHSLFLNLSNRNRIVDSQVTLLPCEPSFSTLRGKDTKNNPIIVRKNEKNDEKINSIAIQLFYPHFWPQ